MKTIPTALVLASLMALAGCGQESHEAASNQSATSGSAERQQAPTLPDGFFLSAAPSEVISVSQARGSAETGQDIAFTGYIGGRVEPFTEGRAVFLLADSAKAPQCTEGCPAPHDACCVPRDVIAANSATVQVVDADGQPLKLDLNGLNGVVPGAEVTVVGTVREANDSLLIVDASGIVADQGAAAN